jgi:hypothetical protein
MSATCAAMVMAASLGATPAAAQTGSGTGNPDDPVYCTQTLQGILYCCRLYDPCQQIWYDGARDDRRPEEPLKPSESPEE